MVPAYSDHRRTFFRRIRGASIGHVSPEAAVGGPIALVEEGDIISIDINNNSLNVLVSDEELAEKKEMAAERTEGYDRIPGTLCSACNERETGAQSRGSEDTEVIICTLGVFSPAFAVDESPGVYAFKMV